MTNDSANASEKLEKMGAVLKRGRRLGIVVHNNPDPDSIAGAAGLQALARRHFSVTADIFYGGVIGRAENRAFINELGIKMFHSEAIDLRKYRLVALVDTQPGSGNYFLPGRAVPDVVIDHHHPVRRATREARFADVRTGYGATSTIVTEYLREAGVRIGKSLATALFRGIKTDTYDLGREAGGADLEAYRFLLDLADHVRLSRIENPPLSREYYEQFYLCLTSAEIYDDVLVSVMPRTPYPDVTAEIADWFYRMKKIRWVLVIGIHEGKRIYFSVRTHDRKVNAARVVRRAVGKQGSAGGHGMIAGGSIQPRSPAGETREGEIHNDVVFLKRRLLTALGKDPGMKPAPLIETTEQAMKS
ncbi:MAG: DHH family phosphoesterase [bacterium]